MLGGEKSKRAEKTLEGDDPLFVFNVSENSFYWNKAVFIRMG